MKNSITLQTLCIGAALLSSTLAYSGKDKEPTQSASAIDSSSFNLNCQEHRSLFALNEKREVVYLSERRLYLKTPDMEEAVEIVSWDETFCGIGALYFSGNEVRVAVEKNHRLFMDIYSIDAQAKTTRRQSSREILNNISSEWIKKRKALPAVSQLCFTSAIACCLPTCGLGYLLCCRLGNEAIERFSDGFLLDFDNLHFSAAGDLIGIIKVYYYTGKDLTIGYRFAASDREDFVFELPPEYEPKTLHLQGVKFSARSIHSAIEIQNPAYGSPDQDVILLRWLEGSRSPIMEKLSGWAGVKPLFWVNDHVILAQFFHRGENDGLEPSYGEIRMDGNHRDSSSIVLPNSKMHAISPDLKTLLTKDKGVFISLRSHLYMELEMGPLLQPRPGMQRLQQRRPRAIRLYEQVYI